MSLPVFTPLAPAVPAGAVLFKRILLVESDPLLIDEIRECLDLHFFDVTVAPGPVDAIRELIKRDYDALICDLTIRDFPARMFFKAVERVRGDLSQRFITIADASSAVGSQRHNPGMLSIWKPVDLQVLLVAVRTVLKKERRPAAFSYRLR